MANQSPIQATNMQTTLAQSRRRHHTVLIIRALKPLITQEEYITVSTFVKAHL